MAATKAQKLPREGALELGKPFGLQNETEDDEDKPLYSAFLSDEGCLWEAECEIPSTRAGTHPEPISRQCPGQLGRRESAA